MRKRIQYGFVIALLLIALGFALTLLSYNGHRQQGNEIQQSEQILNHLNEVRQLLVDAETGVRGYIATREEYFLEPQRNTAPRIRQTFDRLRPLVTSPGKIEKLRQIEDLASEKLVLIDRQIRAVRQGESPEMLNTYMRLGKSKMDYIRRMVSEMYGQEAELIRTKAAEADESFRNTVILTFILSVLTFVTLIVSYNLLESELSTRQKTEEQLRSYELDLQEKIIQLEVSNEELERFAFVASHDMQEPLRKIQSFAFMVRDRYGPQLDEDGRLFLGKIQQSAERMSKMIKDLLNFSRISNKKEAFQEVHLQDVVAGILNDQELRIKNLHARIEVGPLPVVEAVPDQMDHLFINLISNALKFSKPDVQPEIKIFSEPVDGSAFEELLPGKNYFKITVQDNGIGFDEKYLDHIFKIFQRLHGKSSYEGTGIGLAICKRILNNHRGVITAQSSPNAGAAFIVVLPENQNQPKHDTTAHETRSHLVGG
ncbi:sensor histidine kinase [Tellurirhabdus rosea]|uniref:sensor histidine kinase n=1 Tax=Tellurirhabdus rosea TaxID=2674997 RepID=UPI002254BB14|nr:sensor histidine kinase [Tellurirhabdus rosea]